MPLFDRAYKLIVGQPGAGNATEVTGLKITFNIIKTLKQDPNRNEAVIWGLSPETRARLERPNTRCELHAGYNENGGPILMFRGNVTFCWHQFDRPDVMTNLELSDGDKELRDTLLSLSYGKGVSNRKVISDIASAMGCELYMPDDVATRVWEAGFSFYGGARSALNKAARASGLAWSIQNGVLQVIKTGGATQRRAIVLADDSGMIGSPERQRQTAAQVARVRDQTTQKNTNIVSASREYDGWRVKTLLMPSVNAGDQVKLESESFNGTLIASEIAHRGNSWDGDWITQFMLVNSATAEQIRQDEKKKQEAATKRAQKAAAKAAATPVVKSS